MTRLWSLMASVSRMLKGAFWLLNVVASFALWPFNSSECTLGAAGKVTSRSNMPSCGLPDPVTDRKCAAKC